MKQKENDPDMFEPLLEDEDEVMKYTAVAVYKVSLIDTLYFFF